MRVRRFYEREKKVKKSLEVTEEVSEFDERRLGTSSNR